MVILIPKRFGKYFIFWFPLSMCMWGGGGIQDNFSDQIREDFFEPPPPINLVGYVYICLSKNLIFHDQNFFFTKSIFGRENRILGKKVFAYVNRQNKTSFFFLLISFWIRFSNFFVFFFMGEKFLLPLFHRYKYCQNKTPVFILGVFFLVKFSTKKNGVLFWRLRYSTGF